MPHHGCAMLDKGLSLRSRRALRTSKTDLVQKFASGLPGSESSLLTSHGALPETDLVQKFHCRFR
eukprot:3299380-Rhodomonas_salina.1